jgi:dysferlin
LKNEGWEYAPMFNMKFHADERSMDMTRRRRWHRKMVPSAEENLNNLVANTDMIFRMQSQVSATTDSSESSLLQTTDKEVKIELNAPRMFLTFKSKIF